MNTEFKQDTPATVNVMHVNSDDANEKEDSEKMVTPKVVKIKSYWGKTRSLWLAVYIGTISFTMFHNIFTFIVLNMYLEYAYLYVVLPDILILFPILYISHQGVSVTKPETPERYGSWNVYTTSFWGMMLYWSVLWTFTPYYKYIALLEPTCVNMENTNVCSWFHHPREFFTHAITGPVVLCLGTFNMMKISRGLLFTVNTHRWLGRVHNIFQIVSGVGAIILARVITIPTWVRHGFYILSVMWFPTMGLGWYHIVANRNITQHYRWMSRNYSITAAAVTIRFYSILDLGTTPYYFMIYVALIHPAIVEVYLQHIDDCDRKWFMDLYVQIVGSVFVEKKNSSPIQYIKEDENL